MVPGLSEAGTAVKIGASLIQAVRQKATLAPTTTVFESLLELHAMMYEWWERSDALSHMMEMADFDIKYQQGLIPPHWNYPIWIRDLSKDREGLLSPKPSIFSRWRGSQRRKSARKGIRAFLSVYDADLLARLEEVSFARESFVGSQLEPVRREMSGLAEGQRDSLITQAQSTSDALWDLCQDLAAFIRYTFPFEKV
jgi:hypothetical protein